MLWLLVLKMLKCVQGMFVTEQCLHLQLMSQMLPFSHLTIHNNVAVHGGFFYSFVRKNAKEIFLQMNSGDRKSVV